MSQLRGRRDIIAYRRACVSHDTETVPTINFHGESEDTILAEAIARADSERREIDSRLEPACHALVRALPCFLGSCLNDHPL